MLDLGEQPLSGSFPTPAEVATGEPRWPLRAAVCTACWWTQLADDTPDEPDVGGPSAADISPSIGRHADDLIRWLGTDLGIRQGAHIVEVASHGNLLASRLRAAGFRTTTVEGHPSVVRSARSAGLDVIEGSLTDEIAARLAGPDGVDLLLDTFMLSHVRAPRQQLRAVAAAIGTRGVAVIEVDHALPLLVDGRFDAVRHGHFSYVSLSAFMPAAAAAGLRVVSATRLSIYGGAMRVVLTGDGSRAEDASVDELLVAEADAGVTSLALYDSFAGRAASTIRELRSYLEEARAAGRRVVAYGAPSRGNTMLNAASIGSALIEVTADASPAKQGRVLPGSHLPIVSPEALLDRRPDIIVILTWDIADEVVEQLAAARAWGCTFLVPMPRVRVLSS